MPTLAVSGGPAARKAGDEYGVLPSNELDDGDDLELIHEFDPYQRYPAH